MSTRPRNIRKKPADEGPPHGEATGIAPARPRTVFAGTRNVHTSVRERLGGISLDEVGDRVPAGTAGEHAADAPSGDDDERAAADAVLQKRIAAAKREREERRRQGAADDFISLQISEMEETACSEGIGLAAFGDTRRRAVRPAASAEAGEEPDAQAGDEIGPLERIADVGVDEEVFEDIRGDRVRFGVAGAASIVDGLDADAFGLEDAEAGRWEEAQIRKGLSSAGLKAPREVRKAEKEIRKAHRRASARPLLGFDSLEQQRTALLLETEQLERALQSCRQHLDGLRAEQEDASGMGAALRSLDDGQRKLAFCTEMGEYVRSFSAFVDEKMPLLARAELGAGQADALFDDALPEFGVLANVLGRFGAWEAAYPDSYAHACADTHLVHVMEIFVQRQLARWRALEAGSKTIPALLSDLQAEAARPLEGALRDGLLVQHYLPCAFAQIAATYDPESAAQTDLLREFLGGLAGMLGREHRSLATFRAILEDIFAEAKRAAADAAGRQALIRANEQRVADIPEPGGRDQAVLEEE